MGSHPSSHNCSLTAPGSCGGPRLRRLWYTVLVLATLGACLLPGRPVHADGPATNSTIHVYLADGSATNSTIHVYLYNSSGTPVDVTGTYSYQEGHVYDSAGHLVGNVPNLQTGQIYNLNGVCIGYVAQPPQ